MCSRHSRRAAFCGSPAQWHRDTEPWLTEDTERSKVKIIQFLLNICIKCKIIFHSISFTVIFNTVAFANLGITKQTRCKLPFPSPIPTCSNFSRTFSPPLPPLTSENLQSCNPLALTLHFQVIVSKGTSFLCQQIYYFLAGKKKTPQNYRVLWFLYFFSIFIFLTKRQSAKSLVKKTLLLLNWLSFFFFFFFYLKPDLALCPLASYRLIEIHSSSPRQEKGGEKSQSHLKK